MWLVMALFAGFVLGWFTCAMLTVGKLADAEQERIAALGRGYAQGYRDGRNRRNP